MRGRLGRAGPLVALVAATFGGCAAPEEPTGPPAGQIWPSRATITFTGELAGPFDLVLIRASLDGEQVAECDAGEGRFVTDPPMALHDGPIAGGDHRLDIELRYRGRGHGVFSYLGDYSFTVRSEHAFEARGDEGATFRVEAHERGDATTPLEARPALRYVEGAPAGAPTRGCPRVLPSGSYR